MDVKTVGIIGAGISGLASIKSCLEENLVPICFEYFDTIGGTWNLTEHHVEGQGASVYDSMRLNTSKNMTCFSDFPFPEHVEHYPDCHTMRDYIQSYAEHFHLLQYIKYNCDVISVCPTADHETTGRWVIKYIEREQDCVKEVDAVMVCSGRQRVAKLPNTRGMDTFTGETMHVIDYRRPSIFKDKVVLVIGNGSSSGDVAVDAAKTAKQVCLCTGDGAWIVPRLGLSRVPADYNLTRFNYIIPSFIANYLFTLKLNRLFDHYRNDIIPARNRGPLYSLICINDHITEMIKSQKIIIKHDIEQITPNGVAFKDGTSVPNVDMIVYATGYKLVCKFLSTDILAEELRDQNLYRVIFPVSLRHPTLGLVGCVSLRGATTPTYEMQARWLVALFMRHITLPSVDDMMSEVNERKNKMLRLYKRPRMWETGVTYQQELAEDLHVAPPLWWMITQPRLLVQYYTLAALPMFNRLYGRHSWPGAWDAIQKAKQL